MYRPQITPDNPHWQAILENPYDNMPRLVFADWLDEHGENEFGEYLRNACNKTLRNRDKSNQMLWANTWLSGMPTEFVNLMEWEDGLPSYLNLAINRRQALLFHLVPDTVDNGVDHDQDWPGLYSHFDGASLAINLKNVDFIFKDMIALWPIREINLGCCRIFPHFKKMIWYNGSRITVNGVEEARVHTYDGTLHEWWRRFNGEVRSPISHLGRDVYEDLLRGHGNVRLTLCAGTTTVRHRRRLNSDRRSMVQTVSRNAQLTFGYDVEYVYRV